ncbi:DEAD/DEAH box helicase [Bacillus massiliigorillae]|uniref:DEAD/DEAH box helicase n=1 Tax=Bacillus massiliigorillae TaxID=1243664 RepID=UPI00039F5984|nr:DEAD/DEAH box helicase [Bacillus massiliigorillae]
MKLNQHVIKEMCGTVSFKRGEAFHRADKVRFQVNGPTHFEAIVQGKEDFHVKIDIDENEEIQTACSCPTLSSFTKDCQHIAAVLLAIHERSRRSEVILPQSENYGMANDLLQIFSKQSVRSSRELKHFEDRQMLELEIVCEPLLTNEKKFVPGIELRIGAFPVLDIRSFLIAVQEGKAYTFSLSFTYDPVYHCFSSEQDNILQQLIRVLHDDKLYMESLSEKTSILPIPPSSWSELRSSLVCLKNAKLRENGDEYTNLGFTEGKLPLNFYFSQTAKGFQCEVNGLNRLILMKDYHTAIIDGQMFTMTDDDTKRLYDLQQMLTATGANIIPIEYGQLELFLERVVPGLKKLGNVQLPEKLTSSLTKTPLIANLYLDRIKNRLLAGVEFQYGDITIDPFKEAPSLQTLLIRDEDKEMTILELFEENGFLKSEGGYYLQNEELEYDFLNQTLPKLQQIAKVYATTAIRNRILRAPTPPRISVRLKKDRTNWLEFNFEQDGIPDYEIRGVLQALEEKRKYYRLKNGSLLSLDAREYDEIRRFLNTVPIQEENWEMPVVQGLQHLGEDNGIFQLEASFREFLKRIEQPDKRDIEVPAHMNSILYPYQIHGFKWLKTLKEYGFGGILADDMGLGKTLQAITYLVSEQAEMRRQGKPALIVCPSSLTYNWLSELMKFAPEIEAVVADGIKSERQKIQQQFAEIDVFITSYPLLRQDLGWFRKQTFHTVFFDEAQAFKNPVTQTAKAVKMINADHSFALTGTPMENSPEELWSIFHVVFPELFMGLKEFSNLRRKTISRRIRPFMLRRVKEDVLDELPKKLESLEFAELFPEQKKLYIAYLAKLRHDTLKHLDRDTFRKNKIRILAGLTRLRQICCHPALFVDGYDGRSAKFEQLLRIVEECSLSGRRVLIFSQFTKMLHLIRQELAVRGLSYFYLDGQTPSEERVDMCTRFNKGENDFFLISLKAGGTGLNLTGADTVVLYDLWWNPAVEEQATDRAHRLGQRNNVQVIKLVTRGTIEAKMNDLQEKKRNLIEEIIESDSSDQSSLTDEDICQLLNLDSISK